MEIKSLSNNSFDTIFEAFRAAFADYELQLDRRELAAMLERRGFNPELSFAAFDGDEIVAFTLNGTGNFNGEPTAYDTGTGTLKEHRGRGLATRIFEYSIPWLAGAGIKQYLLEVLQHNTGAVSVYRNLGFETSREFNYFRQDSNAVDRGECSPADYAIKPVSIDVMEEACDFRDFHPSWQNSFEAIRRVSGEFICLGAYSGDELKGYAVFEPASGDVTQLAVRRDSRRKGVGSLLFDEMLRLNKNSGIKIINTDPVCSSITAFLKSRNIELAGKQFEMIRKI